MVELDGHITNVAEIAADDAEEYTLTDIDSEPDANIANDNQPSSPEDDTDDTTDNLNGDEDDHDLAGINYLPTYDLALQKEITSDESGDGTLDLGETFTSTITVTNEGDVLASDIEITDFAPEFTTLADDAWTVTGTDTQGRQIIVYNEIIEEIAPGETVTLTIDLTVDTDHRFAEDDIVVNAAAITDSDAGEFGFEDIDDDEQDTAEIPTVPTPESDNLAFTGATTRNIVLFGIALVVLGLVAARRNREDEALA